MKIRRSDTAFAALLFILTSILVTPLLFMNEVPAQSANHNWDRAYERLKNKDCAGALPYLKRADEDGENVYWIYNNLVNCLLKNEDRAGALHYARKGMTRYPHETVMRKTLIWALSSGAWKSFGDKDYAGAENLFREAYDLDNNDAEVLNGYGVALRENGSPSKLEQSVGLLEKAFSIDHEKNHILGNLTYSRHLLLRLYAKNSDFNNMEKAIGRIYAHYNSNLARYKKHNVRRCDIEEQVVAPYDACGVNPTEGVDMHGCTASLQRLLDRYPENYRLKHILGNAVTNTGNIERGYTLREEAYGDYLKYRRPIDPKIVLCSPLKGRVHVIKYNPPKPKSHSGLWRHAMDYIVIDAPGKNISYNSPVYAPADGEITHVGDGSEDLSNLWLKMKNGLTVGLVHFKPGSFTVRKGERVIAGQKLGVLGIPGNAHLHMHIFNEYGATIPYLFKSFQDHKGAQRQNAHPDHGTFYTYP